jgi:hypothetical protein
MFRYGRRTISAVLLVLFFAAAAYFSRFLDPDLWWHLRTGQAIVEAGSIPRSDIFSFTNYGREWVAHEWLSEVVMYAIYRAAGFGGLLAVFAGLITAAFAIAYALCRGTALLSWAALILAGLASSPTWGVRPQIFTLLLASLFLYALTRYVRENRTRLLWLLPPLTALWANLHSGVFLGLVLVALAAVGLVLDVAAGRDEETSVWRRTRPLIGVLGACALAALLTPHGARLYSYPFETLYSPVQQAYIVEWNSPDFQRSIFLPLAALIIATFSALALSPKRPRYTELLLLAATCYAALKSGRHIPFLALVAMPLLSEYASHWLNEFRWARPLANADEPVAGARAWANAGLLVVAALLAAVFTARLAANLPATAAEGAPVAAVAAMQSEGVGGPVFNTYHWGGYLVWRLHPRERVYIDGRADVYGDAFFDEYTKVYNGLIDWRGVFDRYGIRTALIEPQTALATSLRQQPEWRVAFEDAQAVVFVR